MTTTKVKKYSTLKTSKAEKKVKTTYQDYVLSIAQKIKENIKKEEEEEKEFEWAEDKLLDDNDKTERDFQEMMNNLNRMDNMMHGDDLRYIR